MDTLDQILDNLWTSDYVQKNPNKAYKAQYNAEYLAIATYINGGARPNPTSYSKMGKTLVGLEDQKRAAEVPAPEPEPEPVPEPEPEPPPTGAIIWSGDFDTGDTSQYDTYIRKTADRWRVTTGADGVAPLQGTHMARVEGRQGEGSPWDSGLIFTGAINSQLPVGYNKTYTDAYLGWAAWVPSNFPALDSSMHPTFMEWHGAGSMQQAPFHWGILGNGTNAGKFYVDLHRNPTGYNPVFQTPLDALSAPGMADSWHRYVLRILWSQGSNGRFQFWQDGVLRKDYTGPTAPISGENLKLQACLYCANKAPASRVVYFDEVKIGTSYAAVSP